MLERGLDPAHMEETNRFLSEQRQRRNKEEMLDFLELRMKHLVTEDQIQAQLNHVQSHLQPTP